MNTAYKFERKKLNKLKHWREFEKMTNPTIQTTSSQIDFEISASKYQKGNNKILNHVSF